MTSEMFSFNLVLVHVEHTWTVQLSDQHHTLFLLTTRFDKGINLIDVCKIQGPIGHFEKFGDEIDRCKQIQG